MKTGIQLIAKERKEQIEKHGRSVEQDVIHNDNYELLHGARSLLLQEVTPEITFPKKWDKKICNRMRGKSYKERLIIAGAFIAAEIDRLQAIK